MTPKRAQFVEWCQSQLGKPYIWGAKGPDTFDCSGLITAGLLACGHEDWRQTHNSARLFDKLEPVEKPEVGDFAFYGPPHRVTHVMVVWFDGQVYGASGGNRDTITPRPGAAVQTKRRVFYRRDFRGFRKNPLKESPHGNAEQP